MSAIQFDASKVAPQGDRSPLPAGQYKAILQASEIKKTDKGSHIAGTWRILEGPCQGMPLFQNITFLHSTEMAQRIGQERLSALCHAVGILQLTDTTQLHGRAHQVKVSVRDGNDGKVYNEIDAFLKEDGSPVTGSTTSPATTAAPAWAGAAAPTSPPAPAPAPAPVAQTPPPTPAPPVVTEKKFHVAFNGAALPGGPFTLEQVRNLPQGYANVLVCAEGGSAWEPGTTLAPATPNVPPTPSIPGAPAGTAAVPAPAGLPPWMQGQPAV